MQLEMIKAVNLSEPGSNLRLFTILDKVIEESGNNHFISMANALCTFTEKRKHFLGLLHTIPQKVRDSLILGTLAYDFYGKSQLAYSDNQPGIYAYGLAIRGRNGKFLNAQECSQISDAIGDYLHGYYVWEQFNNNPDAVMSPAHQRAVEYALRIDDAWIGRDQSTNRPGLLFLNSAVDGAAIRQKASLYCDWLKKRGSSFPESPDFQEQSPVFVGCSSSAMKQMHESHTLASWNNFQGTSPLLALTASAIKFVLKLDPETVIVPVLAIWDEEYLKYGEMLVTALASSLVTQGGLNIIQGGGQPGIRDDAVKRYVFGNNTAFDDNLKATEQELEHLSKAMSVIEDFDPLSIDDVARDADQVIRKGEATLAKYQETVEKQDDVVKALQEYHQDLKKKIKIYE